MTKPGSGRGLWAILLLVLASRLLLTAAGLEGQAHLPSGRRLQPGNVQRDWTGPPLLDMWARWDSEWYLLIAEKGYHLEAEMEGKRAAYGPADATGFFPLYPVLIRGVATLLASIPGIDAIPVESGSPVDSRTLPGSRAALLLASLLVSNACLLGSLLLLAGHVRERSGPEGGRAAFMTCAALLAYPPSLFLSAAYPASLLLFLALLAFRLLRRRSWWSAALVGGLASAAKPSGVLLMIPAAVAMAGTSTKLQHEKRPPERWLSLLLYPAGLAAFAAYCRAEFGDPLSWYHRQLRWRGAASGPWQAFVRWWEKPVVHGSHGSSVELAFAVLALILLMIVLWKRPAVESAYASAVVVLPLTSTLWSFGRLTLPAFPLFIVVGLWAARRPRLSWAWFLPMAAGGLILMRYYAAGFWAG